MSLSKTSYKIAAVLKEIAEMEAVELHYKTLHDEETKMLSERASLEKRLTKELKDVEKLEGTSVKSLFYKVLGSKEQQLDKERQEYLQVSLKHSEHLKSLDLITFEKEVIEKKLHNIDALRLELESLKKTREKEILSTPSALRNELHSIIKEQETYSDVIFRLEETLKVGEASLQSLSKVINHFRKAKDWGNWDMGSKRSYHYGRMKHNAIDNAVNESHRSNLLLKSFNQSLAKVGYNAGKMNIGFQSFSGFMDVLFDNLISDWIVQSKIKNALTNTEAVADRVSSILQTINNDIKGAINKKEQLSEHSERLLER